MPRYRVKTLSFIGGALCAVGTEVEFDGKPGSNLEPLDDEAKAASEAAKASQPEAKAGSLKLGGSELVEIPADWENQRPEQIINLARKLGAPVKGTNKANATTFINDEIVRRATV